MTGLVFYTDGGCREKSYGYGAHGYAYEDTDPKTGLGVPNWVATAEGYRLKADAKKAVTVLKYFDAIGRTVTDGSNNLAEIMAIYEVLTNIYNFYKLDVPYEHIQIYTDSEVAIRWVTNGIAHWKKNGWKKPDGKEVPYRGVFTGIDTAIERLKKDNIVLDIQWVKGHSGHLGNDKADTLASIGVMYSVNKQFIPNDGSIPMLFQYSNSPKGYWTDDVSRHPLLDYQRLYYYSCNYVPGTYYLASYDYGNNKKLEDYEEVKQKDKMFGSPHNLYRLSIIRLNTPDKDIESVRLRQADVSMGINHMVMLKMETLYSKDVLPGIREHGGIVLDRRNTNTLSLSYLRKKEYEVTIDRSTAGLSMMALDDAYEHERLLNSVIAGERDNLTINRMPVKMVDVTEIFYSKESDKKGTEVVKLKPEFSVGFKTLAYEMDVSEYNEATKTITVPLILGYDLPSRNALNRLADSSMKIYVLSYADMNNLVSKVMYCGLVVHPDGAGIYINMTSNFIYLPRIK